MPETDVTTATSEDSAVTRFVVEGLNVYYGQVHILQDVTFRVYDEPVAMVGRNGMGKTTLAKTIVGLLSPESGSIRFEGKELARQPPYKVVRSGIGYVPQGRRIFPTLSVHEHLRMVGAPAGARWTAEAVYELFPRLADRRNQGASNLSGGEQQMLAIARALLTQPRLLVMDEPSEGLAPAIVDLLAQTLRDLATEGQQTFVIEQNLRFASELSDHLLVMVNGRVATEVAASDLLTDPELQSRYLGVG
ncbi:ABC transporter ATP-binding protein [Egibacter rhizosphaerae]|uniref:ABC transporter ATP-binding protein n=1 Tax=Egibacter rhizosphaerae TaxID=1670831 RepID=A0A411YJR4_9ACTN|nr:ABC transporter ATP-binding protein [Egibacter rhizosphaerae]QBI21432.1 ABC transporter ATP-binding protein [Egibacter rhizosphaerae]